MKKCDATMKFEDELYCWWYECSNCKNTNITRAWDYCPNCGAKIESLIKTNGQ